MSTLMHRLGRAVRRAREINTARRTGGPACGHCGFAGSALHRPAHLPAIWPALAAEWDLSPQWLAWMNDREGSRCAWCGSSRRASQLAATLVATVNAQRGTRAGHLRALVRALASEHAARPLAIAEINSAGNLHRALRRCPGLRYSEFGSQDPAVPSEDLTRLSYASASFDLAITSDTLEHVPDIDAALREIWRILKPGAAHVFTVPVLWDRPTRMRAVINAGQVQHLLPPSYHGAPGDNAGDFLVFHEFGADFVERCTQAGFNTQVVRDASNPALCTFVARRPSA